MTLLPNKHVPTSRSLVGIGALLLEHLEDSSTVSGLWELVRNNQEMGSFRNFVLTLDYLYVIGAIDYEHGFLRRSGDDYCGPLQYVLL